MWIPTNQQAVSCTGFESATAIRLRTLANWSIDARTTERARRPVTDPVGSCVRLASHTAASCLSSPRYPANSRRPYSPSSSRPESRVPRERSQLHADRHRTHSLPRLLSLANALRTLAVTDDATQHSESHIKRIPALHRVEQISPAHSDSVSDVHSHIHTRPRDRRQTQIETASNCEC